MGCAMAEVGLGDAAISTELGRIISSCTFLGWTLILWLAFLSHSYQFFFLIPHRGEVDATRFRVSGVVTFQHQYVEVQNDSMKRHFSSVICKVLLMHFVMGCITTSPL